MVQPPERATHSKAVVISGGSMGNDPNTIPNQLRRGEPADVVILADSALNELIKEGKVAAGSRVQVARSIISMAVRAAAPKPDISTVEALTQTFLSASCCWFPASHRLGRFRQEPSWDSNMRAMSPSFGTRLREPPIKARE